MSAAGGLPPVATPPQPGPLYVAPTQPGVKLVVGRFDAVVGRLKPDMKECAQPLRMRKKAGERTMATISGSAAAVAGAEDANRVLELSDAHGEHVLLGTKEKLESHYIAITRTTGPDGQPRYYAAPVDEWFTFASAPDLPARSAEEEAELQDKLLRFGERPTAAALMRRRVGEAFRDEGGEAASSMEVTTGDGVVGASAAASHGVGADEDDESNNYRAHAARHGGGRGGSGGGAGGDGMLGEFAPDDLDGAYDALDAGAGGDGENAGAGGGGYAGAYGGGGGDGEEGGVAEGRTFDVFGREADAEEVAADLDICFDDDAGDAGEEADAAQANLGADDAEVAANAGEEEEVEGVDVEGDDQDAAAVNRKYAAMLSKQAKGAAGAGAGAGAGAESERGPDGKRRRAAAGLGAVGGLGAGAGAGGEAPAAKRARFEVAAKYQDPLTALRQRLRSVVVAHGGRVTMQAVGRAFKAELRGSQGDVFRATLTDVMKAMLRRVIAPDGVTTVYVFRENTK